ncbi:MAG: sugar transferase [Methylocella sp.]
MPFRSLQSAENVQSVSDECNTVPGNACSHQADDQSSIVSFPVGGRIKRLTDVIITLFVLPSVLIIILSTALILKCTDPGPILYKQFRLGYRRRAFVCFKLRTMVVDSENVLKALLESDPESRAEWNLNQKLVHDPRVTPFGQFLRRSSIDELPQLLNVLRGDMSLVGPRPIIPSEAARYGDQLGAYFSARPGLTGAWQVSDRDNVSYEMRVAMDAEYVREWRFWTDVLIMLRTLGTVVDGKGCY